MLHLQLGQQVQHHDESRREPRVRVRDRHAVSPGGDQLSSAVTIDEIAGVADLNRIILEESRGVVIDFWGTWCQPCRSLRPHLERLAADHADQWRVVAVHVEENSDLVDAYAIQSTPTLVYLRGGDEVHRSTGAVTPSSVEEALQQYASA